MEWRRFSSGREDVYYVIRSVRKRPAGSATVPKALVQCLNARELQRFCCWAVRLLLRHSWMRWRNRESTNMHFWRIRTTLGSATNLASSSLFARRRTRRLVERFRSSLSGKFKLKRDACRASAREVGRDRAFVLDLEQRQKEIKKSFSYKGR